ncbi:MAG TPA: hypothetical protein VFQ22_04940 [Longimicrobiales bacterium]|nr:hypothetical protein [Longimicrobiales bacterium]
MTAAPRNHLPPRGPGLALALVASCALAHPASAQSAASGSGWQVPRTEWGDPDLQGNWTNATLTPLTRPAGRSAVLTWEEAREIEAGQAQLVEERAQASDPDRPLPPGGDNPVCIDSGTTCYNEVYRDPGDRVAVVNGEPRSSLVTRPADGRVPPLTGEAQRILAAERARLSQFDDTDHPELRPLGERCIVSFGSNAGPPMLPNYWYNNNYTIVQSPDAIVIMAEMVHDARIIRLGEPKRLPKHMRPYFGDSWGRWEGDTLVVETTNLNPDHPFRGVPFSEEGKVIERFTRVDEETILYEFTIDDPVMYTEPWGGEIPFKALHDLVYEYACHEGNYALEGVLRGARYEESQGAAGAAGAN